MDRIEDFAAFVAIVEQGSLTAAARQVGRSLQSVSRSLAALERNLGVELLRRTTRSAHPTPAGLAFHARIKTALADIQVAKVEASGAVLSGRLRVGASFLFGQMHLVPVITSFLEQHPGVVIDLHQSDAFVNLADVGLDVAVRIGALSGSSLKKRKLALLRDVTFAAPSYLAKHGYPKSPQDLVGHECVNRTSMRPAGRWRFRIGDAVPYVRIGARFHATGAGACNEAVARGFGIGRALLYQIRAQVDLGQLELILTEFEPPPVAIHAVWPANHVQSSTARRFIDYLAARFAGESW
ncbi:LysR family transcriptional regulator [Pendulispora rubella]|uniref:LysR family transcriptional regulator n=1 Tax=Pendulispora rubella TaxID=2741070 RepID=A0ABZ2LC32_9BACT